MAEVPIRIDRTKCRGCGKCVGACGFGALRMVDSPGVNKLGRLVEVDSSACKACFACVAVCPFGALSESRTEVRATAEIDSYRDIWVFAEQSDGRIQDVVFELLGKGLELKAQRGGEARLCAVLLGYRLSAELISSLAAAGADRIYLVDDPKLADYDAVVYVDAVAQLATRHRPEIILAGATAIGRAFFARVAVRLRTGLTADCTSLKIEETRNKDTGALQMLLHQTRPAFGGNVMATIMTPNHRPQMATVRPKVFKRRDAGERVTSACEVVREALVLSAAQTRLIEIRKDPNAMDIASSPVLVAGGRGLKCAENFELLFRLAKLLGGEVACSRAAVDAGWMPSARQVGQTGRTVAPRLYLCFGISGAIQHLEGIRGAEKVIAVNTDPSAPIFSVADVGIVGDAKDVLLGLIAEFGK